MNPLRLWSRVEGHHRLNVAVRCLLAVPGAYLVGSLFGAVLARQLPMKPVDASMAAVLVTIVVVPLLSMWAVGAATAARATVSMAALALVLGGWSLLV